LSLSGDVVTGAAVGKDTITYSLTNFCGTTTTSKVVLVKALPVAGVITDAGSVCMGATITLSESVPGGVWTTSNGNASVSGDSLTGVVAGADSVIYLVTDFCGSARTAAAVNIIAMPTAGMITASTDSICVGSALTLADSIAGGNWSSLNLSIASVDAGVVTGVASGTDTIKYLVTNVCGTAVTALGIAVLQAPVVTAVSGRSIACLTEKPDTLYGLPGGGVWTSSNMMDTILQSGVLLAGAAGSDTLTYTVTNICGSSDSAIAVTVYTKAQCDSMNGVPEVAPIGSIKLYPNPTTGEVTIALPETNGDLVVTITNLTGSKVFEAAVPQGQHSFTVDNLEVASGTYMVEVTDGVRTYRDKLVVIRR
jgi:Secretion system C-terminal sorting domain